MTKYELYTDTIETMTNKTTEWSAQDVWDAYNRQSSWAPHLAASAGTAEELKEAFEAEMKSCHARTHSGSAGLYLEAEIGYIQRSEYDEDGDFDQGEIIDWFAASCQPEGCNE